MHYLEQSCTISYLEGDIDTEVKTESGIYLGIDPDGKHQVYVGPEHDSSKVEAEDAEDIKYISGRDGVPGSVYWGNLKKNTIGGFVTDEEVAARYKKYNTEINKINKLLKKKINGK